MGVNKAARVAIEMEQGAEAILSHDLNTRSTAEKPCPSSSPRLNTVQATKTHTRISSPQLGCSRNPDIPTVEDDLTLGKLLENISPVPKTSATAVVRKRGRQLATILNSSERISMQKDKKKETKTKKQTSFSILKKKNVNKHKKQLEQSSDSGSESPVLQESDMSLEEWDENECVGCGENYFKTSKSDDWIKCVRCSRWFHDDVPSTRILAIYVEN